MNGIAFWQKIWMAGTFLILILGVLSLGSLTETALSVVFVALFPTLLHWIFLVTWMMQERIPRISIWISPLIIAVLFFLAWQARVSEQLSDMDGPAIVTLNLLFMLFYNVVLLLFIRGEEVSENKTSEGMAETNEEASSSKQNPPIHPDAGQYYQLARQYFTQNQQYADYISRLNNQLQQAQQKLDDAGYYKNMADHTSDLNKKYLHQIGDLQQQLKKTEDALEVTQNNFSIRLRSIEDKCKALNFAIGRVYSNKKGGTNALRKKILVDRELYNSFSDMSADLEEHTAGDLLKVLMQLYEQLTLLERQESDLFKDDVSHLDLEHDKKGRDMILDVLARNDKDPVMEYYAEAKEICMKLIGYVKETFNPDEQ
ncbi:MAG: hypothetical protein ACOCWQ_05195 [Nanoarchaeota archaeon]